MPALPIAGGCVVSPYLNGERWGDAGLADCRNVHVELHKWLITCNKTILLVIFFVIITLRLVKFQ